MTEIKNESPPVREQFRYVRKHFPVIVIAIVATWIIMALLAVAFYIAIVKVNDNANEIKHNNRRGTEAICAVRNFAETVAPASRNKVELDKLAARLNGLVSCQGGSPTGTIGRP